MKRFTVLSAAFVVLALGAPSARAVVVFQDNFDGYADQTAFTTAWQPIGCQGQDSGSGTVCSLNTSSTTSNELNTGDFAGDPLHLTTMLNHSPVGSPGTADSSERNQISFTQTPALTNGAKVSFSYDFYDLAPTAAPFRQFMNLQTSTAAPGSGQLISIGLNNNQNPGSSGGQYYMARVLGYSNPAVDPDGGPNETNVATNYIKLNDHDPTPLDSIADGPGARGTVAGWHNLKVVISTADSGVTTDFNFYVDGVHAEHINAPIAPKQYGALKMGAGVSALNDAYYDNVLVEFTPAAAGLSGDFNSDGKVDAGDYDTWRKNETANAVLANDNGVGTQAARFSLWRANFGNPPGAGSGLSGGAVPEPTSIVLLVSSLGLVFAGRRRTR